MSSIIRVQLDILDELAGDLAALAGDLADDADRCRAAAAVLHGALTGDAGLDARWAATSWSALVGAVADGTQAVSATLAAAVTAYRTADEARAEAIARQRRQAVAVAW
jgi:uncharacterized protein YukE